MREVTIINNEVELRYFIDLNWYQENGWSFSVLAHSRLCSACQKRLRVESEGIADPLVTIGDCCSKAEGFITSYQPILESVFRLFLASGNQPLDLDEINQQLDKWRGANAHSVSPQTLCRLLDNDQYYGLRQVPQDERQDTK